MSYQDFMSRIWEYGRRHGVRGIVQRAWLALKRIPAAKRMVLFYCDLHTWKRAGTERATHVTVERKRRASEITSGDLLKILDYWNPRIMRRLMSERFAHGASLWLVKVEKDVAGYGWTLNGHTIEPHFFPLGNQDVHLFDFFVFPEFRGRRINAALMLSILDELAAEQRSRAFIEAAEWNIPQLHSLGRMPFQRLGCTRKVRLLGRTIVLWRNECPKWPDLARSANAGLEEFGDRAR